MRTLLSERFAPITWSIGFLELTLDQAIEGMGAWRRRLYPKVEVQRITEGFPDVLHRLEPLVAGARPRELLVASRTWTAYFDCLFRGTNAVSSIGHLSRALECRGLAITAKPHTLGKPGYPHGYLGSISFELFGPTETHFLNYVRTVYATYDSKWEFGAHGLEQPFEETESYRAKRVSDRFTSGMLERYCQALGVDVFNPAAYGPESAFFQSEVILPPDPIVMSLEDAQEALEIRTGAADDLPG